MKNKNLVYGFFMILIIITVGIAGCVTANDQIIGGDKDEHGCLIAAGYSWCGEKQKCIRVWEENCTSEGAQIANPASVYCEENGGTFTPVETEAGTTGYCNLSGGRVCEEWAFFRSNGTTCNPPS